MGEPDQAPAVGLSDLTMMVMTGGMERTLPEWRALAATFSRAASTPARATCRTIVAKRRLR